MQVLYLDFAALANDKAVEEPLQNGWPVREECFKGLVNKIISAYDKLLHELPEPWDDLVLADVLLINQLAQHLHYKLTLEQTAKRNIALKADAATPAEIDWATEGRKYAFDWSNRKYVGAVIRDIIRPLRYNLNHRLISRIWHNFRSSETWSLGAHSGLKIEYQERQRLFCRMPDAERIAAAALRRQRSVISIPDEIARKFDNTIKVIVRYCWEQFSLSFDSKAVLACWLERINNLATIYRHVLTMPHLPSTILLGALGYPPHRVIALAARRAGSRVYGFQHGSDMGYLNSKFTAYSEFSVCDEYICATKGSRKFNERLAFRNRAVRKWGTQFGTLETALFSKQWERAQTFPKVQRVETVLVAGYPMNTTRYVYGTGEFWWFRLAAELRAAKILRQEGYRVIYKPHPISESRTVSALSDYYDDFVTEPFESVMEHTDALLFTYPLTTTFGNALCTNRPIILIDIENRDWNEEAYELLQLRCAIVPARFSSDNRLVFKAADLLAAVNACPNLLGHDYMQSYMFPETAQFQDLEST